VEFASVKWTRSVRVFVVNRSQSTAPDIGKKQGRQNTETGGAGQDRSGAFAKREGG
jgi:hypothetical protein